LKWPSCFRQISFIVSECLRVKAYFFQLAIVSIQHASPFWSFVNDILALKNYAYYVVFGFHSEVHEGAIQTWHIPLLKGIRRITQNSEL
jgi:hypothetical protein